MINRRVLLLVALTTLCAAFTAAGEPPAPRAKLRVLIISGQNNHDWAATTPKLKQVLEAGGRFSVDVTERPDQMTAAMLEPYDLLLSNWNTFGKPKAGREKIETWSDEARQAYVDFVKKQGKGLVTLHAGSSAFYDWPEYHELALATWKMGQTGHGPPHEFDVRIEPAEHAITRGLSNFRTDDELWHRPQVQDGVTVLASSFSARDRKGTDQWEPTAMAREFERGRAFTLLLGHDDRKMDNEGFKALLTRGCEWAATGKVVSDKKGS